jgi:uncharacterized protein YjiS (DUF1127 family)
MIRSNVAIPDHEQQLRILGHPTNRWPSAWGGAVRSWLERARQRRTLAELDDRLLCDIGITRPQAEREAARAFWTAGKA